MGWKKNCSKKPKGKKAGQEQLSWTCTHMDTTKKRREDKCRKERV